MSDREKILAIAVATLVALMGASKGWSSYQATRQRNLQVQQEVAQELSNSRTATARGRRAQQKLSQWRRQSLPSDPDIAKSLYQDWLQQQLTAAGLQVKELNNRSSRTSSENYQQFSFVVNASGKLNQLTDFLYRFYQAKHLHRISAANLAPTDERKSLSISLTVDALLLDNADRKDQLADGASEELQQTLDQFSNDIVGRNLFATHQPKKAMPADSVAQPDEDAEAKQARISGINYGQDGWQMSIRMEDSGKISYYREGDRIRIGRFRGRIVELDGNLRRVVVATKSRRLLIRLGDTLADAQPYGETSG